MTDLNFLLCEAFNCSVIVVGYGSRSNSVAWFQLKRSSNFSWISFFFYLRNDWAVRITCTCSCLGGSILSTRCSETYETKTALMSLFGFPLWYFSQSPRAVIQVSSILIFSAYTKLQCSFFKIISFLLCFVFFWSFSHISQMYILVIAGRLKVPLAIWWFVCVWRSFPRPFHWNTSPKPSHQPATSAAPHATSQSM